MKKPVTVQSFFKILQNPSLDLPAVSRFILTSKLTREDEEERTRDESAPKES